MVSALASSSVKLPRNVSVKLFVSDCDLLCDEEEHRFSSGEEGYVSLTELQRGLTSAVGTVSERPVQRRRGWGRAGRPGWETWWLSGLSEATPGPTEMERQRQTDVPLQYVNTYSHYVAVLCHHRRWWNQ